jgi:hypothetical protein
LDKKNPDPDSLEMLDPDPDSINPALDLDRNSEKKVTVAEERKNR